ncbi:MAG: hypothetical protein GF419_08245 [Ignavibacteriales bacterium]|jgi:hypothetical protein|nr:hypothetical protein [Ignavibacteriales bacterium]
MKREDFGEFQEYVFKEISYRDEDVSGNIIKSGSVDILGAARIEVEEESLDGVKIVLKKDQEENIREIKFVCSCGQTKSIILDYNDEEEAPTEE